VLFHIVLLQVNHTLESYTECPYHSISVYQPTVRVTLLRLVGWWVGCVGLKIILFINDCYNAKMYIIVKIHLSEKEKLCFCCGGTMIFSKMIGRTNEAKGRESISRRSYLLAPLSQTEVRFEVGNGFADFGS
jgi:hypothetical protein